MRTSRTVLLTLLAFASCTAPPSAHRQPIIRFTFPWSDKPAPPTRCDLHTTAEHLNLTFTVEDNDLVLSETWTGESNDNWLSWARPDARQPDFHIPSALKLWRLP